MFVFFDNPVNVRIANIILDDQFFLGHRLIFAGHFYL